MNNFPNFNNFNFNFVNPKQSNQSKPAFVHNTQAEPNPISEEVFKPIFNAPQKSPEKTPVVRQEETILNYEVNKMDTETLLKYLQSTLKMPSTLEKFIKSHDTKVLKILVQNLVDTKALSEFLNKNSTSAIETILKAISSSIKSGNNDVRQLKDILGILNAIQSQTSLNTDTIKELLLLYIPLNPMVFDKQVDFSAASREIEEKINSSTLSIIFETINYSNILCCINSANNTLYLELFSNEDFPFERFRKIITVISKEINYRVELEQKISRKINSKEPQRTRNFKIISSGFIPTEVLLLASIVIKTIIKADEIQDNPV